MGIEAKKEKALRIFSLVRDHLSPKYSFIQNQLEECIVARTSYDKFFFIDLNVVELASYSLYALINVFDGMKDSWKKHLV